MPSEEENVFFDVVGVSKYLNASLSTIYKLAQNGGMPCQKMGRQWRFSRAEIDRWIANRRRGEFAGYTMAASKKNDANANAKDSSPVLEIFFTDDQIRLLNAFDIKDVQKLALMLASSKRRAGIQTLLKLSSEELDDIVDAINDSVK